MALTLWATGVLDLNTALAGFGDQAVIFIAALFVVSESLDATGVTAWAGQLLVGLARESRARLIVSMLLLVAARDGADQRQRGGRGAPAGDGRHRAAPAALAVASS